MTLVLRPLLRADSPGNAVDETMRSLADQLGVQTED